MAKPLSEQLADLSISAKKAEDAVAAARKEAQDKVIARREQAHAAAAAAIQKVDRDIKSAGDSVKSAGDSVKSAGDAVVNSWRALQAKVSADMDALNAKIALGKHKLDVKHADHHAERLEREASFAVDYAAASIEEAKYAVLDAIVGRIEAEKVKSA
jgi:hypothetical protein